jgi:hypothetical protein
LNNGTTVIRDIKLVITLVRRFSFSENSTARKKKCHLQLQPASTRGNLSMGCHVTPFPLWEALLLSSFLLAELPDPPTLPSEVTSNKQ